MILHYIPSNLGRIWLDNVDCDASDEILEECRFNPWGTNNCNHGDDVGVICRPGEYIYIYSSFNFMIIIFFFIFLIMK